MILIFAKFFSSSIILYCPALRCGIQFLGNLAVGNQMCKDDIWQQCFPDLFLWVLCAALQPHLCIVVFVFVKARRHFVLRLCQSDHVWTGSYSVLKMRRQCAMPLWYSTRVWMKPRLKSCPSRRTCRWLSGWWTSVGPDPTWTGRKCVSPLVCCVPVVSSYVFPHISVQNQLKETILLSSCLFYLHSQSFNCYPAFPQILSSGWEHVLWDVSPWKVLYFKWKDRQ